MKRAVCLLLLIALLPSVADAQRRVQRGRRVVNDPMHYHTGSFMIGVQHLDLSDFNSALTARYPTVDDNLVAAGGQGMHVRRHFIIGAEGMGVASGRHVTTGTAFTQFHTRFMGGYGTLNLGYAAVNKNGWLVYPLLGLGVGGVTYTLTPVNGTTFQDVLQNPGRSSQISTASMIVALRAGVQYNLRMHSRRMMMPGGLSLGVRGAYNFAPFHGDWHMMEQTDVTNGPRTTLAGPQLVFTIGGWRQSQRR